MRVITRSAFLSIVVIVLLLVNSATILFILFRKPEIPRAMVERMDHPHPPFKGHLLPEQLGFTADQTRRFELLREEHFASSNKLRESMRETRELLFDCIIIKDTAKANFFIAQIGGISSMLESNNFRHFSSVRDLCTREQLQVYSVLLKDIGQSIGPPPPPSGRPAVPENSAVPPSN